MPLTLGQILRDTHNHNGEEETQRRHTALQEMDRKKLRAFKEGLQRARKGISAAIHKGLIPDPWHFPEGTPVSGIEHHRRESFREAVTLFAPKSLPGGVA